MKEEKQFKTESKELLHLMIHSIYSNKEIFLRELLSNASDAIDKYRFLSVSSEGKYPQKEHEIRIEVNEEGRYLQITDNGIGMSKEDMENHLGTIAKSGTKEFVAKMQEAKEQGDASLIGQFGVGFYSAFMVADKVEVYSRDLEGHAYKFESDGVDSYSIEDDENPFLTTSGTAVRVYLKKDTDDEKFGDYLREYKISHLVKQYSDFIRYPIRMRVKKQVQDVDKDGKPIEGKYHEEEVIETLNSMTPIWKKPKKDVTEEDLNAFYKSRFNDYEDPLFSLSVKVEGTLDYDALLFIPKHPPYNLYSQNYEKGLALYAKGVFIEERCKDLVPDYLKFVRGLIDSEDLSLNISREMLQKSPILDKMAKNIEKKVIDKLKALQKDDPAKYEEFYKHYGNFIKFGIYSTYGAKADELKDLLRFPHLNGEEPITFAQYKEAAKEGQKAIYYASGKTIESLKALPGIARFKKSGEDVLLFTEDLDEFTIQMMTEYEKLPFKNISTLDPEESSQEEKKKLEDLKVAHKRILDDLTSALQGKVDEVGFSLTLEDNPVCIATRNGLSLQMENVINESPEAKDNPDGQARAEKVLLLNPDHPLFEAVSQVTDEAEIGTIASVLYGEALLAEGFDIPNKAEFVKNLNAILGKAYSK
ncbi:MAG: molecular chaperone HtpG [Candidatus Enteromonas sp.]|nr:molecular chaperone HtpG [Candidatus Enteromonas sp.]